MASVDQMTADHHLLDQDLLIARAFEHDGTRLRNYIRRQVMDPDAAEDILQDVFSELIEAYRMLKPIEQVSAWLFRVAKNRIIDRFRGRKLASLSDAVGDDENTSLADLLPSQEAGPEVAYASAVLQEEFAEALDELPEEQRSVFIKHEVEGYSFHELAAETGVSVNTLLSRKRYAVLHLRRRLQAIFDEFVKK
jgi:RNA polymerase sigma factor (sigma-70 family)